MAEERNDRSSRFHEYQQRVEQLMTAAREGLGRQTPEVLEKLATTARTVASRLDEMAREARQRQPEQEAAPESAATTAPTSEPPDKPPRSPG